MVSENDAEHFAPILHYAHSLDTLKIHSIEHGNADELERMDLECRLWRGGGRKARATGDVESIVILQHSLPL